MRFIFPLIFVSCAWAQCTPASGYSNCAVVTQHHGQNGSSNSSNFPVGIIGTANGIGSGAFASSNVDLRTVANGGKIQNTQVSGTLLQAYYVSGGSFSGTGTCNVTFTNSITSATGTLQVTGGTVSAGAQITVTNVGNSANGNQMTTASLASGTATCSGTATIKGFVQWFTIPTDLTITSDSSGTMLLPFEIASYTASTGAIEIYVNESISSSSDTLCYLSYGNSSQTTTVSNMNGTWNSNFGAVYHFNQNVLSSGSINISNDSTVNNIVVAHGGGNVPTVSGIAGLAPNFSSTAINLVAGTTPSGALPAGSNQRTMEGWLNMPSGSTYPRTSVMWGWVNGAASDGWGVLSCNACVGTGNNLLVSWDGSDYCYMPSYTINTNWHYLANTFPSGQTTFPHTSSYLDGSSAGCTEVGSGTVNTPDPSTGGSTWIIGNAGNGSFYWTGYIDEVRVSNVARSADWITATYNNFNAPGSFVTVGNAAGGFVANPFIISIQ